MLIKAASDSLLGSLAMYRAPGETLYMLCFAGPHEQSWVSTIVVPIVQLRKLRHCMFELLGQILTTSKVVDPEGQARLI